MAEIRPTLLLDCDPGIDDAVAIALALRHAEVVGITTVGGNVGLEHTTANALALCDLFGRPEVPVHAGHDEPLGGQPPRRAPEFHGATGTGSVTLPRPCRDADSDDAVDFIVDSARTVADLWLVFTGPLTNLAHALDRAPDIVDLVAGVSWMGGGTEGGNATAAAEFNAFADPEAADAVFRAGFPRLLMSGLNVTQTVRLPAEWIADLAVELDEDRASITTMLASYEQRQRDISGVDGAAVHDAVAVGAVTHPHLVEIVPAAVEVVTADGPTRGMTLVDRRPRRDPAPANVEVVERADAEGFRRLVAGALRSGDQL